MAVDPEGNLYVLDGSRVRKRGRGGKWSTLAEEGKGAGEVHLPSSVTVDGQGRLYVLDHAGFGRIQRYTPEAASPRPGDVDGGGRAGVRDVLLVLRHLAGVVPLDESQQRLGDADGDGGLGIQDVLVLLRQLVGLPR